MTRLGRRRIVLALVTAAAGGTRALQAQTSGRLPRVLLYTSRTYWKDAFETGMRERGWVGGRNVAIDWQQAASEEGSIKQVESLVRMPPDVAVVGNPQRIEMAMKATATVPIVGIDLESDPVAAGFVNSLSRPGRNVSGIWLDQPELAGKLIEFLREIVPSIGRVGVLWDDRVGRLQFSALQAAARASGISVHPASVHTPPGLDEAVRRILAARPQAILALTASVISRLEVRIAELARRHRLPSVSLFSTYAASGGLMAYGPSFPAIWRQAAGYVDRILKGARIRDLPVERPSKFELIVNAKTAKALGLTIPQSLLWRADEVIQ